MFKNIEIWAKPTSVYDGDTLTVNILFPPKGDHFIDEEGIGQFVTSLKVRCNGYDTPEMRGKTALEKKCALISKVAFIRKINFVDKNSNENGLILLSLSGLDKYGRALGTVYVVEGNKKVDVNQYMIDNDYGYPYSGATKVAEDFLKKKSKVILSKKDILSFTKEENQKYESIK
jgi:Micrococcal nuclease (thermonuclease) homologs